MNKKEFIKQLKERYKFLKEENKRIKKHYEKDFNNEKEAYEELQKILYFFEDLKMFNYHQNRYTYYEHTYNADLIEDVDIFYTLDNELIDLLNYKIIDYGRFTSLIVNFDF